MGDVCHQYFNGNVEKTTGISVENQTTIELHQHFFTELDRRKLHNELMAFQKSDPDFFKSLQLVCIAMRGDVMFVKLDDVDSKKFYEIKNILFAFYQEKENHRLSLSEEKAKVAKLEMEIAIERNRVALFQKEVEKASNRGLSKIFKRFFGECYEPLKLRKKKLGIRLNFSGLSGTADPLINGGFVMKAPLFYPKKSKNNELRKFGQKLQNEPPKLRNFKTCLKAFK